MSPSDPRFPATPGSYLLVLYLPRRSELVIGKLGASSFKRGWYLYAGSAFGPGGLRARLAHHLGSGESLHWHIDYLRRVALPRSVYYRTGTNNEHRWPMLLKNGLPAAEFPVAGFGSSDCLCLSHLVYLPRRISSGTLWTCLGEKLLSRRVMPTN